MSFSQTNPVANDGHEFFVQKECAGVKFVNNMKKPNHVIQYYHLIVNYPGNIDVTFKKEIS